MDDFDMHIKKLHIEILEIGTKPLYEITVEKK
jgi:hypothetical protein